MRYLFSGSTFTSGITPGIALGVVLIVLTTAWPTRSQEGFPLDGTWRGEWGPTNGELNHVVIVMKWNGDSVSGRINPGPDSIDFAEGQLDAATWGVHIAAETADGTPIRIDGTLEDIGSYNRRVAGTWRVGDTIYNFRITRE